MLREIWMSQFCYAHNCRSVQYKESHPRKSSVPITHWVSDLTLTGRRHEAGVASLALTSQLRAFTRASEQLLELLLI
jgi:hypothetical protein